MTAKNNPISGRCKIIGEKVALQSVKKCHVCGNKNNFRFVFTERNEATKPTYWRIPEDYYVQIRCNECGVLFVDSEIDDQYVRTNHREETRSNNMINDMLKGFEQARFPALQACAKSIVKFINSKKGCKVLDVGCSLGTFLDIIKAKGFHVFGIDIAPEFIEYVKNNVTRNAFSVTLEESHFRDDFFDVITCWETLEHVVNVKRFLVKAHSLLKEGGFIAISVPSSHYVLMKILLFGKFFERMRFVRNLSVRDKLLIHSHIYSFSPKTLRMLFESNGFKIIRVLPLGKPSVGGKGIIYNLGVATLNKIANSVFWITCGRVALSLSIFLVAQKSR